MKTNIVSVKYEDKFNTRTFGGKSYTYYTNIEVGIGDLVIAPTVAGDKIARISEIDIPSSLLCIQSANSSNFCVF